jgi:hypothetical protein
MDCAIGRYITDEMLFKSINGSHGIKIKTHDGYSIYDIMQKWDSLLI